MARGRCLPDAVGPVFLDHGTHVLDIHRAGHAMQEQQRADAETGEDAFGQVAEHDQQEGRDQHHRIAREVRSSAAKAFFSAMFQATTTSTPPSAASGI